MFRHLSSALQGIISFKFINSFTYFHSVCDRFYQRLIENRQGYQLFDDFCTYKNETSIFNAFTYMDTREDTLRFDRDNDTIFQENFYELSQMYSVDPNSLMQRRDDKYWEEKKKRNRGIFYQQIEKRNNFNTKPFYPKGNEEKKKNFDFKPNEEKRNFDFKPFYPSNYGKDK